VAGRPTDDDALVLSWIRCMRDAIPREGVGEGGPDAWAFGELDDICWDDPERCWDLILRILAQIEDSDVEFWEVLAAGPLEGLITRHGAGVIDRVEEQVQADPRFKLLLGGI